MTGKSVIEQVTSTDNNSINDLILSTWISRVPLRECVYRVKQVISNTFHISYHFHVISASYQRPVSNPKQKLPSPTSAESICKPTSFLLPIYHTRTLCMFPSSPLRKFRANHLVVIYNNKIVTQRVLQMKVAFYCNPPHITHKQLILNQKCINMY